jgi:hypothetical protein
MVSQNPHLRSRPTRIAGLAPRAALVARLVALGFGLCSCGARTGLWGEASDGGDEDVVTFDARRDRDAARDTGSHNAIDAAEDGLVPCDPTARFIYLVTEETDLYRFYPTDGSFFQIGTLACPLPDAPFSMGVSRSGTAYVLYGSLGAGAGQIFRVNTRDASCEPTEFVPGQHGFNRFGMGFAINEDGRGETLYVGSNGQNGQPSLGLGFIDLTSFELNFVGRFSSTPGNRVELTSSDDGQLYGYFLAPGSGGGYLVRIDKTTAVIREQTPIAAGTSDSAFAFAYWEGDFYIFTGANQVTTVTRYRPVDASAVVVGTLGKTVVGAGVSTCNSR